MAKGKVENPEVKVETKYIAKLNIKYGELEIKMGNEFEVLPDHIEEFIEKGIIQPSVE